MESVMQYDISRSNISLDSILEDFHDRSYLDLESSDSSFDFFIGKTPDTFGKFSGEKRKHDVTSHNSQNTLFPTLSSCKIEDDSFEYPISSECLSSPEVATSPVHKLQKLSHGDFDSDEYDTVFFLRPNTVSLPNQKSISPSTSSRNSPKKRTSNNATQKRKRISKPELAPKPVEESLCISSSLEALNEFKNTISQLDNGSRSQLHETFKLLAMNPFAPMASLLFAPPSVFGPIINNNSTNNNNISKNVPKLSLTSKSILSAPIIKERTSVQLPAISPLCNSYPPSLFPVVDTRFLVSMPMLSLPSNHPISQLS